MNDYTEETLRIATIRAVELHKKFLDEVERLLETGALSETWHNRGILFGVALENMADAFLRGKRTSKEYKNLKHF